MKRIRSLIWLMVLCVSLTACQSQGVDADRGEAYNAYAAALENLIENQMLPDGSVAPELTGDMAQNKFALSDVDKDGKEELILMYTNTYMAGQAGYVLAYDEEAQTIKTQLMEFPLLTFYDNGIIKADWSHNQGRAGEAFWPYSLYQYVLETDSYVLIGMVDAWDKSYPATDEKDNPFPSDIDKSGTGFVYYIMEDGQYDDTHPVDVSEYDAWVKSYLGDAGEMEIQYKNLTEENILEMKN